MAIMLKEGLWSAKELAEWFGITRDTFSRTRKKKLEELETFAEFDDLGGQKGILIKEVIIPVYEKMGSKSKQYMMKNFDIVFAEENGCSTMSYLGRQMREKGNLPISDLTAERLARQVRNIIIGNPRDPENPLCHEERGKIDRKKGGKAYLLTGEDKKILDKLINQYCYQTPQKLADLYMDIGAGEISLEDARKEYANSVVQYNCWLCLCQDFERQTGYWPVKVTVDDRGNIIGVAEDCFTAEDI